MDERSKPTLDDLAVLYAHLADRASGEPERALDPLVINSLGKAIDALRGIIPGLEAPPDAQAARILAASSAAALAHGRPRDALARALRGLSFAPQHPELHYLAGSACLELGFAREGVRCFVHALWIHPGYSAPRHELEAMSFFDGDEAPGDDGGLRNEPFEPFGAGAQEDLRFEFDDDIDGEDRKAA